MVAAASRYSRLFLLKTSSFFQLPNPNTNANTSPWRPFFFEIIKLDFYSEVII